MLDAILLSSYFLNFLALPHSRKASGLAAQAEAEVTQVEVGCYSVVIIFMIFHIFSGTEMLFCFEYFLNTNCPMCSGTEGNARCYSIIIILLIFFNFFSGTQFHVRCYSNFIFF
jgi:hypothetical protein